METIAEAVEATLSEITFDPEHKSARLLLISSSTKDPFKVCISGIREMSGYDLKLTNIIDRIQVFTGKECGVAELRRDIGFAIFGNDEVPQELYNTQVDELVSMLCSSDLKLISIEAVYGAEFVAVAQGIEVQLSVPKSGA